MIKVRREGVILRPSRREFENLSVYNPGIYQNGQDVHIFYRAQSKDFMSSIGYARLEGPTKVVERLKEPLYVPKYKYESKGIEDPRITKVKDTYYMTYVAHDGINAVIAYAYGKNLLKLRRGGIISTKMTYHKAGKLFVHSHLKDKYYFFDTWYEKDNKDIIVWEKDGVLFPEKINGKYALLHRILPDIQVVYFKDFDELKNQKFWEDYFRDLAKHVVMEIEYGFEARHIGAGAPPIKTSKGWLLIYHAVRPRNVGRIYTAGAALLSLANPKKVIARLPYPLIEPKRRGERFGHVHNVVFPTGTAQFGKRLYIYYGSADSYVSAASVNLDDLLKELMRHKIK
jgi:predicted GH43/DUF377 family glycosyl hydrolase